MPEIDYVLSEKLEKSGFSKKEALVYTALLSSGGAYPSTIAELTKLNRTTVYAIVESLTIKGLVTELRKKNKLFYQVESPASVERYAESQITRAKRQLENAKTILPQIEGLFAHSENKPIVRFFEGREGVLRVYEDHVSAKKPYEMLAWSNTSDLMEFLTEEFRNRYIKKKEAIGITTRAIFPDSEVDLAYNETIYKNFPKKIWIKHKNIPQKLFPYKSDITIYSKNKVSIINFSEGKPTGTIIEDKTIHDMMTMIFELAWQGIR
jgi:sugar-specific transcriptional regulator TrmB